MSTFIPRPLIFIHLPKAGGTTLQELIARQYQGGKSFIFTGAPAQRDEFSSLTTEERGEFDVLLGHVQFGIHEQLPEPATYMTMLRDPVDRVVSHYHFIHAKPEHYLHESLKRRKFSLKDWVAQAPMVVNNYQVRWLISKPMAQVPPGGITREMLEEAKWNLEHAFHVVGIMERYEESLACFSRMFGWRDLDSTSNDAKPGPLRRNANPQRPALDQIDAETIATIKEVNALDLELYEFASTLFEEQCRRLKVTPRPRAVSVSSAAIEPWKDAAKSGPPRLQGQPVLLQAIPLACHGLAQIVILRQYRNRKAFRFTGHSAVEENFRELPEAERRSFDIMWGPLHYGLQRSIADQAPFLTMLRDPVERIIAHYYFVLGAPMHSLHRRVATAGWSLHDYIANQTTLELDNDQVRWLTDIPHKQVPYGRVTRDMLESAKQALENRSTLFGLAEHFEESLLIFAQSLGWQDVRFLDPGIRAKTPLASSIPRETLDLIRQTNALDIELYEFARAIFEQRLALLGEPFQADLHAYRRDNAALADSHTWSNQLGEVKPETSVPADAPAESPCATPGETMRAADTPRDIIWIASYPRSGNSWLRFLLDSYFFPPARYMQEVGRLSGELDWWLAEAARLCQPPEWILGALRQAQSKYTRPDDCPEGFFFKTHFARTADHPLINRSRAAIHLIRDPRDVLLSGMNFSELVAEAEAPEGNGAEHARDKERQYALAFIQNRGDPSWLQTGYGVWAQHARSWMTSLPSPTATPPASPPPLPPLSPPGGDFPVLSIRYEDLKSDTEAGLHQVLEFLGVSPDRHRIRAAVEHCSLARLRNLEVSSRAVTQMTALKHSGRYFFNKGLSGQSLTALGEDIEQSFEAAFAEDARPLGY